MGLSIRSQFAPISLKRRLFKMFIAREVLSFPHQHELYAMAT
jgi:hypothetical protein